jgi:PAS domain S-box-containing protein
MVYNHTPFVEVFSMNPDMKDSEKNPYPSTFENPRKEMYLMLSRLLNKIFPIILPFGGIAVLFSLWRVWGRPYWYSTFLLHIALYALTAMLFFFRRKLPVPLLFLAILGIIYIIATQSLCTLGLAGTGILQLSILCTFAGVFLGRRAGMIALAISTMTAALTGAGIVTGFIVTKPVGVWYLFEPANWVLHLICYPLYLAPLILLVNGMQERMADFLRHLRVNNAQLETAIAMRGQAEEELRRSELKYRQIFDNARMGIFQSTPEGRYLSVNPAFARMHGYDSPQELVSHIASIDQQIYVNPDDRKRIRGLLLEKGSTEGVEVQQYRRDGGMIWVSVNARSVHDEDGALLYYEGTVQNITDRKQAQEALQESETKFRVLTEKSVAGVYLVQDGLFVYANARFAEVAGYRVEEITGLAGPKDLTHPEDWPTVQENILRRMAGEIQSHHYEFRIIRKDGGVRNVEVYSSRTTYQRRTAVIGTLLDITKRKETEELAAERLRFLQLLIDTIPDPIFYKDTTEMYLGCNRAFAEVFRTTIRDIVGKTVYEIFPKDLALAYHEMDSKLFGRPGVQKYETYVEYGDGTRRNAIIEKATFLDTKGDVAGLIGVILDINDLKQAEEALRKSEATLRQVIDLVPHFIFAKDREGKFILVNKAVADVYGTTVEDLTGRTDADFNSNADEVAHFLNDDLLVIESGLSKEIPA